MAGGGRDYLNLRAEREHSMSARPACAAKLFHNACNAVRMGREVECIGEMREERRGEENILPGDGVCIPDISRRYCIWLVSVSSIPS